MDDIFGTNIADEVYGWFRLKANYISTFLVVIDLNAH